jgi:hypothetical protein
VNGVVSTALLELKGGREIAAVAVVELIVLAVVVEELVNEEPEPELVDERDDESLGPADPPEPAEICALTMSPVLSSGGKQRSQQRGNSA